MAGRKHTPSLPRCLLNARRDTVTDCSRMHQLYGQTAKRLRLMMRSCFFITVFLKHRGAEAFQKPKGNGIKAGQVIGLCGMPCVDVCLCRSLLAFVVSLCGGMPQRSLRLETRMKKPCIGSCRLTVRKGGPGRPLSFSIHTGARAPHRQAKALPYRTGNR